MIRETTFWDRELEAPLLKRNAGFITPDSVNTVLERARHWIDLSRDRGGDIQLPKWKIKCDDPASQRIFELDAERTFKDPQHRQDFVGALSTVYEETRDYHQGLGFIVAFLLLFLNKEEVVKIVLRLHRNYVPGYFKAAPVAYVRDAKTYERILEKFFPAVHKHVTSMIPAEAYCSKWFVGFNVHVLPFPALADFFDSFLANGEEFHFKYSMALVKNTEKDIMATNDVGKVLAILRLDAKEYPDGTKAIGEDSSPGNFFDLIVVDARGFELT